MQLKKTARRADFNSDLARQQKIRLQDELNALQQAGQRFLASLSQEQRQALALDVQKLQSLEERINSSFAGLQRESEKAEPDPKQVGEHAGRLEKAVKKWRKQYNSAAAALGI